MEPQTSILDLKPKEGDVLLDTMTVLDAVHFITGSQKIAEASKRASIIQFVEALILHEQIFIDRNTYEFGHYASISETLASNELMLFNGIVNGIEYPSDGRHKIYNFSDGYEFHEINREFVETISQTYQSTDEVREHEKSYKTLWTNSQRTFYYFNLSVALGLPYVPHTLRSPVLRAFAPLLHNRSLQRTEGYVEIAKAMLEEAAISKISELNSVLGVNYFQLDVPVFFNYVARKAKKKENLLQATFEIRDSKEARQFRQVASQFDLATQVDDRKSIIEGIEELQEHLNRLKFLTKENSIGLQIGFPLSIAIEPLMALKWIGVQRKRHLFFLSQAYKIAIDSRNTWQDLVF